jgi:acyl carrier protein
MNQNTFKRIEKFIEVQRGKPNFLLDENTRLYEDLKIYGDDATIFFIEFGKEFNVDVSQFMAADYFKGEEFDIIDLLINTFRPNKPYKKFLKVFTIKQLGKAITAGRLDEELINSNN